MYSIIIFLAWSVACCLSAPADDVPTVIPILEQWDEWQADGTYKYGYETANGIKREEEIYEKVLPKAQGRSSTAHVQKGSYSYTAPDGSLVSMSYIADEKGFRPVGKHILRSKNKGQTETSSSPPQVDENPAPPAESDQSSPAPVTDQSPTVAATDQASPASETSADTSAVPTDQASTNAPEQAASPTADQSSATEAGTQQSTNTEIPTTPAP